MHVQWNVHRALQIRSNLGNTVAHTCMHPQAPINVTAPRQVSVPGECAQHRQCLSSAPFFNVPNSIARPGGLVERGGTLESRSRGAQSRLSRARYHPTIGPCLSSVPLHVQSNVHRVVQIRSNLGNTVAHTCMHPQAPINVTAPRQVSVPGECAKHRQCLSSAPFFNVPNSTARPGGLVERGCTLESRSRGAQSRLSNWARFPRLPPCSRCLPVFSAIACAVERA